MLVHLSALGLFVPDTQTNTRTSQEFKRPCEVHRLDHAGKRGRHSKNCAAVHSVLCKEQSIHLRMVYSVPYRSKGCMVDALASRSDEGRDMAAIRFGEVPNNL